MKRKLSSVFVLLGLLPLIGQTAEQREVIKASMNDQASQKSSKSIKQKQQVKEDRIAEYLKLHPETQRSYDKAGKTYFLYRISSDGKPIYITTKDIRQAANTKANSLYTGGNLGLNITGTNMVAGVWDGGQVNANHTLLKGKVSTAANQELTKIDDHMTAVTGIMIAKKSNNAQGVAYDASTKNYDWDNDIAEMDEFAKEGYLVSNHSYGYGNDDQTPLWQFGAYDEQAKAWDAMLKVRPYYLPFVAVGNEQRSSGNSGDKGFDIITGSSASKNVVTVGAVDVDNEMTDYSNFGPTDDGRIKPEIVTLGSSIDVPLIDTTTKTSGYIEESTGTSYASPAAAAGALLLQQYYYSLNKSYMKASLLKALLLHSATDDASNNGPDNKFGWGILNLENAANIIKQSNLSNGTAIMKVISNNPSNNELAELTENFNFDKGNARASLCWVDDDGVEQTDKNSVDDAASRMVYNFSMKFEQLTPAKSSFPYKNISIKNPSAAAVAGTKWFESANNYLQANLAQTTANAAGKISIRKSKSSPGTAREMALIVTGLKRLSTLDLSDIKTKNTAVVFYDDASAKLKLIGQEHSVFGEYAIYSTDGRLIKQGVSSNNEIDFEGQTGSYILNYSYNESKESYKFIK